MGCGPSTPSASAEPMPESVAFFFNGEPMAGKAEKYMSEFVADSHTLAFVGPHALPLPVLDKEKLQGAIGNLIGSFPDLTFNFTKATPKRNADGSWAADIVVMGTHTGAAYSAMPGKLPPIETTGTQVKIGPETFTLWVDAAGKVVKTEITPLGAGHPHGPPGFYTGIGGVLPAAMTAPPPKPDCLMMAEVKDFADWHKGFQQHATSKSFTIAGKEFTVDKARGEACDEAKTLVFTDEANPNAVAIALYAMDFAAFAPVMESKPFKEMSELAIVSQAPPLVMTPPGPEAGASPSMFFFVEVEDVDKWIAGFKAHATNKTSALWEGEVPITRAEFVDESKTRVFKCATNPKLVGAYLEGVKMEKLGPLLNDPQMAALTKTLGEKEGTKVMNVVAPMPPPPAAGATEAAPASAAA